MTSQIGRDAVLSESYGRGYWYSAKCLLKLSVYRDDRAQTCTTMVKRLQHTKADSAPRPGSVSVQSSAQDQTTAPADSPSPWYHILVHSARPQTAHHPSSPSPQTHHRLLLRATHHLTPPLTPQHTHPEETPPVRAHSEVRRQIREQRLSLSRS